MSRIARLFVVPAMVMAIVAPVSAQIHITTDATTTILPHLSVIGGSPMDFGTHYNGDGLVAQTVAASWTGSSDGPITFSATLSVQSALTCGSCGDPGIPLACGTTSAQYDNSVTQVTFDPGVGLPATLYDPSSEAHWAFTLGQGSTGTAACTINLGGGTTHIPGTYTAGLTLTLTVQ